MKRLALLTITAALALAAGHPAVSSAACSPQDPSCVAACRQYAYEIRDLNQRVAAIQRKLDVTVSKKKRDRLTRSMVALLKQRNQLRREQYATCGY